MESVLDRPWLVYGYPIFEFRLVPERFSESMVTLSLIRLTLDMTSLNLLMKSQRGSSSPWERLQRSISNVSLSMNIDCLRNADASWRKLPMEFRLRRENNLWEPKFALSISV